MLSRQAGGRGQTSSKSQPHQAAQTVLQGDAREPGPPAPAPNTPTCWAEALLQAGRSTMLGPDRPYPALRGQLLTSQGDQGHHPRSTCRERLPGRRSCPCPFSSVDAEVPPRRGTGSEEELISSGQNGSPCLRVWEHWGSVQTAGLPAPCTSSSQLPCTGQGSVSPKGQAAPPQEPPPLDGHPGEHAPSKHNAGREALARGICTSSGHWLRGQSPTRAQEHLQDRPWQCGGREALSSQRESHAANP